MDGEVLNLTAAQSRLLVRKYEFFFRCALEWYRALFVGEGYSGDVVEEDRPVWDRQVCVLLEASFEAGRWLPQQVGATGLKTQTY